MRTTRIGVIRVVTFDDEKLLNVHGRVIEYAFPTLKTVNRCIPDQRKGIHDQMTLKVATPKVVRLGLQLWSEGVDALIVSCAEDPGVEKLRESVRIPVIGAGSAVAAVALTLGSKVGVLTLTGKVPKIIVKVLGKHFIAEAKPKNITTTLDLLKDKERSEVLRTAATLRNRGIDVIALGCTGYTTIGVAPEIQTELKLPVIDPVVAAGLVAFHATQPPQIGRTPSEAAILRTGD